MNTCIMHCLLSLNTPLCSVCDTNDKNWILNCFPKCELKNQHYNMNINHTQVGESDGSAYWLAQARTSPRNEALVQSIQKWNQMGRVYNLLQMVMGLVYLQYTFSILKIKEAATL